MARRAKVQMSGNAIFTGAGLVVTKRDWKRFDALPRAIKQVFWEAPDNFHPRDITDYFHDQCALTISKNLATLKATFATEQDARACSFEFASVYLRIYKEELPHMAAHVSPQRYDGRRRR